VDHTQFAAQVAAFANNYRVLTWDLRGHGLSRPLRGRLSYRGIGEDIVALLDQLGVAQAVLVGVSTGGCAVQDVARRQPQRVAALALIGCPCITVAAPRPVWVYGQLLRLAAWLLPEQRLKAAMVKQANAGNLLPATHAYTAAKTDLLTRRVFAQLGHAVLTGYQDVPGYTIAQPWLLVHGDHDTAPIRDHAPDWAAREPNCRYAVIPNAGHNANQENPAAFNAVLDSFLRDHVPSVQG
jgi:pimeloyl-ACP methyl ester carboxylesterase